MHPITLPHSLLGFWRPHPLYLTTLQTAPPSNIPSNGPLTLRVRRPGLSFSCFPVGFPLPFSPFSHCQGRPDPISAKSKESLGSITTAQTLPCPLHSPNCPNPGLHLLETPLPHRPDQSAAREPIHLSSHCSSAPGEPLPGLVLSPMHSAPPCPFPDSNRPGQPHPCQRKATSPVSLELPMLLLPRICPAHPQSPERLYHHIQAPWRSLAQDTGPLSKLFPP